MSNKANDIFLESMHEDYPDLTKRQILEIKSDADDYIDEQAMIDAEESFCFSITSTCESGKSLRIRCASW